MVEMIQGNILTQFDRRASTMKEVEKITYITKKKPCWKARLHRISNLNAMNPLQMSQVYVMKL